MYEPPRPTSLAAIASLLRVAAQGDGDLLSLLPRKAYRVEAGWLGYSRRSILIVNAPHLLRDVLTDPLDVFPKSDLMVGALEPLVGNSIFVSSGTVWRRQRRMIEPSFSHMRLNKAFASMTAAVDDYETRLDELAASGGHFSLDLAMSHLTADIICRTVFSTSLKSQTAIDVFGAFTVFERTCAQVELRRLIFDPPFTQIPQHADVLAACERIRHHLGDLIDTHLPAGAAGWDDIAAEIIEARDLESGAGFDRKELLDQLGVMFLAGHETTASALTWAFFILSMQPELVERVRAEVHSIAGDGPLELEQVRRMTLVRNVFRESMRLYPPIPFIPRVAAEAAKIGKYSVKKGAMIMIAPWTIHRHRDYWRNPHAFDPDRFSPEREHELVAGTYLPFGLGPRTCIGAGFATLEATLILARLIRRYDLAVKDAGKVRPVARLTIRPQQQLMASVQRRHSSRPAAGGVT
ncbi:MAG: cytochrome P450 [Gammaproteobacteria bacterium]|nr:cytochrome P450 [Gammaproteobacteria bacterium]